jgi:serine/threonine protein kinase
MLNVSSCKKTQNGGKKMGQGSYGCVINPPLECKKSQLLRANSFEINNDYISKIIKTKYSDVAFSELNLGIKLYNLDKEYKYFVPYINACYFKPQKHPDIIYVSENGKLVSSDPNSFDKSAVSDLTFDVKTDISSNIIREHKTKCVLKKGVDYLNLIGPIAGDTLSSIIVHHKSNNKYLFIKNNYWYIFTYLITGLNILHNNKIVHKDIKPSNLIIDFQYNISKNLTQKITQKRPPQKTQKINKTKKWNHSKGHPASIVNCKVRYIDFGLAIVLNKRKYSDSDLISLLANGTMYYTPIDIFAIKILYKLIKKGYNPSDKDFLYNMMTKMIHTYQKNREYYHYEGIRNNYLKLEEKSEHSSFKKEPLNNYYLTPSKYEKIFKYILELYNTDKLQNKIISFIYAWDIYSLGIVFAKIIVKNNIKDSDFTNLVLRMIDLNPETRITLTELLKNSSYKENMSNILNLDY